MMTKTTFQAGIQAGIEAIGNTFSLGESLETPHIRGGKVEIKQRGGFFSKEGSLLGLRGVMKGSGLWVKAWMQGFRMWSFVGVHRT
jgi:hypothetical protein